MKALFAAPDHLWPHWEGPLRRACEGVAEVVRQAPAEAVDAVIYAPGGPVRDFTPFTRVRLVQSLWAGVESIVTNPTLTQPLARMVDPGLALGMRDYCLGWALRLHLGMDLYAQDGEWRNGIAPPLARERRVSVLGMGELGRAVAQALQTAGFDVAGWSGSGRPVAGIEVFGGPDLDKALARAEILVTLLPDTPATRDLLDAARLARLPRGAAIINPGRGTLIVDEALIAALDSGALSHAVLDVFRTEPLPPAHPFWAHPRVTVTPHIAAETRPETAAQLVGENLRRLRDGRPILHLVDRAAGY